MRHGLGDGVQRVAVAGPAEVGQAAGQCQSARVVAVDAEGLADDEDREREAAVQVEVVDLVGGPYLAADVQACAPRGRIVLVGLLAGRDATLDLGAILNRRITIRGTVLRSRPAREKADATAAFSRDVIPLLVAGKVRPIIDRVLPIRSIADAHRLLESNATFGKVVLMHSQGTVPAA